MTNGEERLELKFRLSDGSDIGPSTYAASTTIATLKERIITQWPQDQKVIPKAVNDVKLIYAGKVLENTKTIAESRIPVGELPGVVSTMHVVVQPSMERKKTGNMTRNRNLVVATQHLPTMLRALVNRKKIYKTQF